MSQMFGNEAHAEAKPSTFLELYSGHGCGVCYGIPIGEWSGLSVVFQLLDLCEPSCIDVGENRHGWLDTGGDQKMCSNLHGLHAVSTRRCRVDGYRGLARGVEWRHTRATQHAGGR